MLYQVFPFVVVIVKNFEFQTPSRPLVNFCIYSPVIIFNGHFKSLLKMYVEYHTKRQVDKNMKAHHVYHCCLCFIFYNQTPPKLLAIKHSRTFGNQWIWKLQQLYTKQVSSHFNQGAWLTNKLSVSFNFKQEYTGKVSERAENVKPSIKLTILEEMVKGYHECSFTIGVNEKVLVYF